MRSKTLYRRKTPNKAAPSQSGCRDSHIRDSAAQHPLSPPPPPPLLSSLPIARMRPTKIKPFPSSPFLQANGKKKKSKMHTMKRALRKLKVLLHLRHGKKIPIPRIVLTPPSESESDGEEDEGGSPRRYVVFDERMVSCLDLRLGRGDGG